MPAVSAGPIKQQGPRSGARRFGRKATAAAQRETSRLATTPAASKTTGDSARARDNVDVLALPRRRNQSKRTERQGA